MKITKAVILAGGLGTRVLPASKSVPKEMLNIVDKPAIQYLAEEAVQSGITDILVVTNRGKGLIEDHFDHSFELEANLKNAKGKEKQYNDILFPANLANFYYVRQKETKGTADAISKAKSFVGDEPFVIIYGDDVIVNPNGKPVTKQLIEVYEKYGCGCVGVNQVPRKDVKKYCSLDVEPVNNRLMKVFNIIEKPEEDQILSCFAILGRIVVSPEIFSIIDATPKSEKFGEVIFTDSLVMLAKQSGLMALDFEGTRYDMGNKLGIMKANVDLALAHEEIGDDFKAYIKQLAKDLD